MVKLLCLALIVVAMVRPSYYTLLSTKVYRQPNFLHCVFTFLPTTPLTIRCGCLTMELRVPSGSSYEFQCHNGYQCVEDSYQCDGDNDCNDGSDEEDCCK